MGGDVLPEHGDGLVVLAHRHEEFRLLLDVEQVFGLRARHAGAPRRARAPPSAPVP